MVGKKQNELEIDNSQGAPFDLSQRMREDPRGLADELSSSFTKSDNFIRLRRASGSGKEAEKIFRENLEYLIKNDPHRRRAIALAEMYSAVPDNETPRDTLRQRVYDEMPGRDYTYFNNIVGEDRDKKGLVKKLGGAAGTVVQATWRPVLTRGAWGLADSYVAGMGAGGGLLGTGIGTSVTNLAMGGTWALIGTPLLYGMMGYALYKTVKHFWNKHKEKKLRQEQVEELEKMRNEMAQRYQMRTPEFAMVT